MGSSVQGSVEPQFEAVREAFEEHSYLLGEGGAAFAVWSGGRVVIDLWAGVRDAQGQPWQRDTRAVIQSVGKSVISCAAMLLVERGELNLDERVEHYWPEFAAQGKSATTVRMLLSHSAGLPAIPGYETLFDLDGNGFSDYEAISARLAAAKPYWEPGTAHGYHTYTYGNLVSELIFRVTGVRGGVFFRDEIARPASLSISLGTPESEQSTVAQCLYDTPAPLPEAYKPLFEAMAEQMAAMPTMSPGDMPYEAGMMGLLGLPPDDYRRGIGRLWSSTRALEAEFSSANATSDARSLAQLFSVFAGAGQWAEGVSISDSVRQQFMTPALPGGPDLQLGVEQHWTPASLNANQGLPGMPLPYGANSAALGMSGGGGQLAFCDPQAGIAAGFVRNQFCNSMALSSTLAESLYRCI